MKKRLLLGIGLPLTILPMVLVACGSANPGDNLEKKAVEYLTRVADEKANHKIYDFNEIVEGLYGSSEKSRFYSTDLIFQAAEDQMAINKKGESIKKTKIYYKLGMAKAIYITKPDGNVAVYDSDDHEKTGDVYLKNWQKLTTDNPKSINHPNFLKDLEKVQKFQVTLKDVSWVDVKGEKTQYKLQVEDYYAHLKTALQMNASYRHQTGPNGGGSEIADTEARAKWTQLWDSSVRFQTKDGVMTNEYLFTLFNTDINKLSNKSTFIQKATGTEEDAVTIEAIDSSKGTDMNELFSKVLLNSTYFFARPSAYTKANKSKNVAGLSGEVADYGYYWYGGDWKEMLFAGPYLPSELSAEKESRVQNKNYYDQEWVNSPKSITRFVKEYKLTDAATFQTNQWEAYKKGEVNTVRFSQLGSAEQTEVQREPEKYMLKWFVDFELVKTPGGTMLWNSVPAGKNTKPETDTNKAIFDVREYNDLFSLMMWGKTIAETEDENNSPMISKHYYLGDGLRFRSLLSNAYNIWSRTIEANEKARPWIVPVPEGSNFGGSDASTSSNPSLIDNYDLLNSTFAFGENGEKIASKNWNDDKKYYDKPEVQGDTKLASRSSTYETIKNEMKKLLDSFFSKYSSYKGQKIEFTAPLRFSNFGPKDITALNNLAEMLNTLDDRLEIKYSDKFNIDPLHRLFDKRGSARSFGWNNDYNGIGTWLDGIFHFGNNSSSEIGLLYQMGDLESENQLAKTLPELYKLAIELKNNQAFFPSGSPTFEQRKNATAKQMLSNSGDFHKGTANNFDYAVELSKFFYNYQLKTPNANLLKLVQEIQAVIGVHPMTASGSISNPNIPTPYLKSNKFEDPVSPSSEVSYRFSTYTGEK